MHLITHFFMFISKLETLQRLWRGLSQKRKKQQLLTLCEGFYFYGWNCLSSPPSLVLLISPAGIPHPHFLFPRLSELMKIALRSSADKRVVFPPSLAFF